MAIRNTLIHACTDRRKPKGQPATCLMALFYLISHQWHHSYTVYFGLYVGLSPVAQADLDRLHAWTNKPLGSLICIFNVSKIYFTLFVRGQDLSNMFTTPQLNYLVCQGAHRVLAMKNVYIYTSVAHAQYDQTTYIYARGGGCVNRNYGLGVTGNELCAW